MAPDSVREASEADLTVTLLGDSGKVPLMVPQVSLSDQLVRMRWNSKVGLVNVAAEVICKYSVTLLMVDPTGMADTSNLRNMRACPPVPSSPAARVVDSARLVLSAMPVLVEM